MQFKILVVALFGSVAAAQTTTTPPSADPIATQIAAIVSSYVPQSIAVPFGSAVLSAASQAGTTGNVVEIITSALDATAPPPWVSLLPTEYQPNIIALASAFASFRESVDPTATGSAATDISSIPGNSTAIHTTSNDHATSTGSGSTGTKASTTGGASSSSSTGAAMPSAVVPGAAGLLGLLGVLAAL
ncbi:MAG: hypothetical protein M1840_004940 [Geoglossum simile]|nr:MAG: hypothetical protein M1840_004940 [Geoglossum simile]